MLSRDVVIVHVLAWAALESAQAEGKSELRVSIGIDGFTRSCQAGERLWQGCGSIICADTLVLGFQLHIWATPRHTGWHGPPAGGSKSQQSSL